MAAHWSFFLPKCLIREFRNPRFCELEQLSVPVDWSATPMSSKNSHRQVSKQTNNVCEEKKSQRKALESQALQ